VIKSGESITRSPRETFELGKELGSSLTAGAVFLLKGDLGTGKTVFAKGLAAGLGIDPSEVTSPSFTLINEHVGRLRLVHVDLYRLGSDRLTELGIDEILAEPNTVTIIEWAERLQRKPEGSIEVEFTYVSPSQRRIVTTQS